MKDYASELAAEWWSRAVFEKDSQACVEGAIREALAKAAEVADATPWRRSANEALDIAVDSIRALGAKPSPESCPVCHTRATVCKCKE